MGTLFQDDTSTTLQCPGCGKYISADAETCRFCAAEISQEIRQAGVAKETAEIRKSQAGFYKSMLIVGLCLFGGGGLFAGMDIMVAIAKKQETFPLWPVLIAIVGFGQIIYGLYGMYKEKRRK